MGTFDNLYLNQIKKLQEENNRLKSLLNENEFNIHAWNAGEAWTEDEERSLRDRIDRDYRRAYNRVEAAWEHVVTNPDEEDAHRADQARELTDKEMHQLAAAANDRGRPDDGGALSDTALRDIIRRRVFDHLDKN
jgi:hypothetical protein